MLSLRRQTYYPFVTLLGALTLIYPVLLPDLYAAGHLPSAPLRIKVTLCVLAALGVLIPRAVVRLFFARVARSLDHWQMTLHRLLKIQRLEVASAQQIRKGLVTATRSLHTLIDLALWGVFLSRLISLFPDTQPAAREGQAMVVRPLQAMGQASANYLPNLVQIALILLITRYVLKIIHLFFHAIGAGIIVLPDFYPDWAEPTYKITRTLVFVFVPFLIMPLLPGANSRFFDEISFFVGLLVSLGSTSAIKNMTAGIVLTYTRSFQIGDRVRIGEVTGDVTEKSLFVTRIKTIKNEQIALPNGTVLDSNITNYSTLAESSGLVLHTSITIGYDVDWRQVQSLLIDAAHATPHVQHTPAPFVLQTSLDDYYVSYEINVYTDQPQLIAGTLSTLRQNILDAFHTAGVEIMSPAYSALRNGNGLAIPTQPAFSPAEIPVETPRYTPDTIAPGFRKIT